ncbi:hypothetical protein ACFWII_34125 [Streptomyces sp. NPDC127063]|uniref:hypothetical protein n=1 Tax=Streptomyces sp. NPDC127063 TaxID=3347123 RepID=UPI0036579F75
MTLTLIVVLTLGGLGVYIAYRNPQLGAALLVGLAVITTLYVILEKDPSAFKTDSPPSSTPTQVSSGPSSSGQTPSTPTTPPPSVNIGSSPPPAA